ncbi:hypothetical protein BGP77_17640 [Saccharospirillum sp. MSK14-1]|uniref:hypothetical protein n=1 Tax=Saccharospirillum sp. MSK14-1 TaxID=1897632 RepID=UPI000D3B21BD|nr:hypothetical protein [Saccharospirillum sp. MSK14-1]PTY38262.1 hypothetical protein BGP77_17640 [Saccharospirillum sp. MSK14-1]
MTKHHRSGICSVDYLWVDGNRYIARLKSKSRVLALPDVPDLVHFPAWTLDGSLTGQGDSEELILNPVRWYLNPLKAGRHYLVLCEVNDVTGYAHFGNHRSGLRLLLRTADIAAHQVWIGLSQQYSLLQISDLADGSVGRVQEECQEQSSLHALIADAHATACLEAGLHLHSWHLVPHLQLPVFQLGMRSDDDDCDPLKVSDDLWVARYLLEQLSSIHHQTVIYDHLATPASLSLSVSTLNTRDKSAGMAAMLRIIAVLEMLEVVDKTSREFKHQFFPSENFESGYTSRKAAFRIPSQVVLARRGHLVDQRPRAKADPYRLVQYLLGSLRVSDFSTDRRSESLSQIQVSI